MCVWCGFPYPEVVDHSTGDTVCTNCGVILDRDFEFKSQQPEHIDTLFSDSSDAPVAVHQSYENIDTYINVHCSVTLCMDRAETARVRKAYNRLTRLHPHRIFLHLQQDVVLAIVHLLFPEDSVRPSASVEKLANKLKDLCGV
jgi:transcription initiation factor TFIIIB Brf1 subunit/transcription initiation factor TFIIB